MEELSLRNYAHIGDAVWELFVREYTVHKTQSAKQLHKLTTDRVKASYQANLLNLMEEYLTDDEKDFARRARNTSIPIARRSIQAEYRLSTAFEALIGYWYLSDKERLNFFFDKFRLLEDFNE